MPPSPETEIEQAPIAQSADSSHFGGDERYREAFERAATGMALVGLDGSLLHVNASLCAILGYSERELLASKLPDHVAPDDLVADYARMQEMLSGARSSYQAEKRYLHKTGRTVWALLSIALVHDEFERPKYFTLQLQDFSLYKQAERAARERETWFRTLFEQSPDAVLLIDPHHPTISWPIVDCNAAACQMNGYHRAELIGQSIDILHRGPENPQTRVAYYRHLQQNGPSQMDAIHRRKDGSVYSLRTSTSLITLGGREYVLGIDHDTTALAEVQGALSRANRELSARVAALEEHMRASKLLTDLGEWLHACRLQHEVCSVMARMLGEMAPEASGSLALLDESGHVAGVLTRWGPNPPHGESFPAAACGALRERNIHVDTCDALRSWPTPPAHTTTLCIPLAAFGATIGVLHLITDSESQLTEIQQQTALTVADHGALTLANLQLRESLAQQAMRDSLTNLYNRRAMQEALDREVQRMRRRHTEIGLIMVDIDHFKSFNDTYGHQAGDTLLRAVGGYLQSHIRASDIACRYGGEEFLLILTEISIGETLKRAQTLHRGLSQLHVFHDEQMLPPITVSMGIASAPTHADSADLLVAAADEALYLSKNNGRNQITIAHMPESDAEPSAPPAVPV